MCEFTGSRSPRPICCKNTTRDSVGRSSTTTLTSGTSTPSLNTSTVVIASIVPAASARRLALRGCPPGSLCTATAVIPRSFRNAAMNSACRIDAQNHKPRRGPSGACSPYPRSACSAWLRVASARLSASGSKRPERHGIA